MKKVFLFVLMPILLALGLCGGNAFGQTEVVRIGDGTATGDDLPFYQSKKYAFTQMVYTSNEIGRTGHIGAIAFDNMSTGSLTHTQVTIWMGLTEDSVMNNNNSWVPADSLKQVFHAEDYVIPAGQGELMIVLDSSFYYDGSKHLAICISQECGSSYRTAFKYDQTQKFTCLIYGSSYTESYQNHPGMNAGTKSKKRPNLNLYMNVNDSFCFPISDFKVTSFSANEVNVSWNATGGSSEYEVAIVDTMQGGISEGNFVPVSTFDEHYSFTDLNANTVYMVGVRKACGNDVYSEWSTALVRTRPLPTPLPFGCDFESDDVSEAWIMENGAVRNFWTLGSDVYYGEGSATSMYIANSDELENKYSHNEASTVFAKCLLTFDETGEYNVKYDWHGVGDGTRDYMRVMLVPETRIDDLVAGTTVPAGISSSYVPNDIIALDGGSRLNASAQWKTHREVIDLDSAGNYYMVYMWVNDGGMGTDPAAAVDNILVEKALCKSVDSVRVTDVTSSGATLRAYSASGNTFTVYFRKVGAFAYDTLEVACPYVFGNLEAGTYYEGIVRTRCGEDGESYSTEDFSFGTNCADLELPVAFDFEGAFSKHATGNEKFPYCWESVNGGNLYGYWKNASQSYAYRGKEGVSYSGSTSATYKHDDWLFTPMMTFGGGAEISMWVRSTAYSMGDNYHGRFAIYASTAEATSVRDTAHYERLTITGASVVDNYVDIDSNEWYQITVQLPSTLSGDHYLAFVVKDVQSYSFTFDDVYIYNNNGCAIPTNPQCVGLSSTTATVSWQGSAASYRVYYGAPGFELEGASSVTTTDTAVTLTNLTPFTEYEYRVVSVCNDLTSSPTFPKMFVTTCTAIPTEELPFVEDFSDNIDDAEAPLDDCWIKGNNYAFSNQPYVTSSKSCRTLNSLNMGSNSTMYSYVALPEFEAPLSSLVLSCSVFRYNSSSNISDISVGVMSNPYDINTFTPYDTLRPTTLSEWTDFQISLADYRAESGSFLAFVAPMGEDYINTYIDDITIALHGNCDSPIDPRVDEISYSSAVVSWSDENASSWTIRYGALGFNPDTATHMVNVSNEHSAELLDLDPETDYEFVVYAMCGDGTMSLPSLRKSFRTTCAPIADLPYSEDFESYNSGAEESISPCWVKTTIGDNTRTYPYPTSNAAITGNRGLHFRAIDENSEKYNSYAVMPLFEEHPSGLKLTFKMKSISGSSYGTGYYSKLIIGMMRNPHDTASFDTVKIIDMSNQPTGTVQTQEVTFEEYLGDGQYITFWAMDVEHGSNARAENAFYIDDVMVKLLPVCLRPSNFVVSNITTTSVDVAWEGTANYYDVAYSKNADMSDSTVMNSYEDHISITGLDPFTRYYLNVRGYCDEGLISDWMINPVQVQTLIDCGAGFVNVTDTIGDGTNSSYLHALNGHRSYSSACNWVIYDEVELAQMGLESTNNLIKSISLHTSVAGSEIPVRIYMAETDVDQFLEPLTDTIPLSQMTLVFDSTIMFNSYDWNEIIFDTPFSYSNNHNLVVALVRTGAVTENTEFYCTNGDMYRTAYRLTSGNNISSYTTSYNTMTRANMAFNICSAEPTCSRPHQLRVTDITSSEIAIAWQGSESNYQVMYDTVLFNPDSIGTQVSVNVSGNSTTLQNLESNATYYIYVRSACEGEYSMWSNGIVATTQCDAYTLPFVEHFDTYVGYTEEPDSNTMNPCWTLACNHNYIYPYVSSEQGSTAPNSMYFYGTSDRYSYAALPMFNDAITNLMATFKIAKVTTTDASLEVGVMINPNDVNTFQQVATVEVTNEEGWKDCEVSFADFIGTGRYIAFKTPAGESSYVALDDLEVFTIPSCFSPINVTVDSNNITHNSAIVSWTNREANPVGGYEIEYGPKDFAIGTGIRIQTSTNPTTLNNLTRNTEYDVYVRTICGGNEYSRWSFPASFRTECGEVALPVTYDFENIPSGNGSELPTCFFHYNDATSEFYSTFPYVYNVPGFTHSGDQCLHYKTGDYQFYAEHEVAIFPAIDTEHFPMSGSQVMFWAMCNSAHGEVIVGIMSDPTDLTTFTTIDTVEITRTMAEYIVPFYAYAGTGKYVALMVTRPTSEISFYIDDVTIEEAPSCPRAFNLSVVSVAATSATVQWSDTSNTTTSWVIDYYPTGMEDQVQSVRANTNPFTITGLTTTTKYYFDVRPICASGDTTSSSGALGSFITTQQPASLPYTYNFEDAAEWNNWQTSANDTISWYRGTALAGEGTQAMYISLDNGNTSATNWKRIVNAVAYRDVDFGTDTATFTMNFKASVGGIPNNDYYGIAVLLVDPSEEVVSSNTYGITPWGEVSTLSLLDIRRDLTWGDYEVFFDDVAGVKRVVFYWYNKLVYGINGADAQPGAIDSIVIQEETCARPAHVMIPRIEATSASISWEGDASQYQLCYLEEGNNASLTYEIVSGNTAMISNLLPQTEYSVKLRSICTPGDTSVWSAPINFTTICARISATDVMREEFTDIEAVFSHQRGYLPDCWEGYTSDPTKFLPRVINGGGVWYAHDMKSLLMTAGSSFRDTLSLVRLPYTNEPVHALTLSFWMCTESSDHGALEVGYLTGDNLATDFVAVKTINASEDTKFETTIGNQSGASGYWDTVAFTNAPAEAQAVAFRWRNTNLQYAVCLDDIELTSESSCFDPIITDYQVVPDALSLSWSGNATHYQLMIKKATTSVWSDTITIDSTHYTFTNLSAETTYDVQLRAKCADDLHSNWLHNTFTTAEWECVTPTNLALTNIDFEEVTLSWDADHAEASWVVNLFNTVENRLDTVSEKPYTITNLYANYRYSVAVKSLCGTNVSSEWSDTLSFTTKACPAVTDLTATHITTTSATITWNSLEANEWQLRYGEDVEEHAEELMLNVPTYQLEALQSNTQYEVYVRTHCIDDIYGGWSNITFRTLDEHESIDGVAGNFQFQIYPNPTTASTTISVSGVEGKVEISVVDMNGRTVVSESIECDMDCEKQLNVSSLSQGTYFVRIVGDSINSVRKLIVK